MERVNILQLQLEAIYLDYLTPALDVFGEINTFSNFVIM